MPIMKKLNCRMWENVLERRFIFSDVEISTTNETNDGNYYGEFTTFSHLIKGVEETHFYYCDNMHIVTFNTERQLHTYMLKLYNVIK